MDILTVAGDVLHLVITVPVLAVGIVIGAFGYRYLLKNDPKLLSGLVTTAYNDLQKIAAAAQAKAASAPAIAGTVPVAAVTSTAPVATVAAPTTPAA